LSTGKEEEGGKRERGKKKRERSIATAFTMRREKKKKRGAASWPEGRGERRGKRILVHLNKSYDMGALKKR